MGAVVVAMVVIMGVGGLVIGAAAWLHHLAGSVESQARVRRWRFQALWHAYRLRLRSASWARAGRRRLATRLAGSERREATVRSRRVAELVGRRLKEGKRLDVATVEVRERRPMPESD